LADSYKIESYKEILRSYAAEALTGSFILPLPQATGKTYSATEIGDQMGISANRVGIIANSLGLKAPVGDKGEYGEWFVDKARYSSKEVTTFRYNLKGFDAIKTEWDKIKEEVKK
jgi:hypothetical protein